MFVFIFVVAKVMALKKGTTAGLRAGAITEPACLGTAGEVLPRLG